LAGQPGASVAKHGERIPATPSLGLVARLVAVRLRVHHEELYPARAVATGERDEARVVCRKAMAPGREEDEHGEGRVRREHARIDGARGWRGASCACQEEREHRGEACQDHERMTVKVRPPTVGWLLPRPSKG